MKCYLLIFNNLFGSRLEAIEIVKKISIVSSWRCDMPGAIYLKSDSSAQAVCDAIRKVRSLGRFLVCEVSENRQGYLTKETWDFLKNSNV